MRFILFLILLGTTTLLYAQNGGTLSGLDGKYTPKTVDKKKKKNNKSNELGSNNAIGLSAGHLVRQMAVISYERYINDRFAIKVSGGYCFGKDLSIGIFGNESTTIDTVRGATSFAKENDFHHDVNYYGDITGKVYTNLNEASMYDILYRFYAGLSFRAHRQAYKLLPSDVVPSGVTFLPVNSTAISFVIGQAMYRDNGMCIDYYLGLGRISSSSNTFSRTGNSYDYIYSTKKSTENKLLLTAGIVYSVLF